MSIESNGFLYKPNFSGYYKTFACFTRAIEPSMRSNNNVLAVANIGLEKVKELTTELKTINAGFFYKHFCYFPEAESVIYNISSIHQLIHDVFYIYSQGQLDLSSGQKSEIRQSMDAVKRNFDLNAGLDIGNNLINIRKKVEKFIFQTNSDYFDELKIWVIELFYQYNDIIDSMQATIKAKCSEDMDEKDVDLFRQGEVEIGTYEMGEMKFRPRPYSRVTIYRSNRSLCLETKDLIKPKGMDKLEFLEYKNIYEKLKNLKFIATEAREYVRIGGIGINVFKKD